MGARHRIEQRQRLRRYTGVAMESSTGTRGSSGQMSNGSNQSGGSSSGDGDEIEVNNNPDTRDQRDLAEAWWSVGEFLESKNLTHQSAKFTLTGNRVFGNQREEVWDLSDSLMELYETIQRTEGGGVQQLKRTRNDQKPRHVDISDWLSKDISHGFIRVYAPDMTNFLNSRLVPVTLSSTVQQVTQSIGLSMNSLHVQLNGDIIRRMDAYEHPLVLQNEYLTGLGFDDITRIQEEGALEELGFLIRFYSGKPMMDSTFSRNQLQAFLEIKKGGVLQNWIRRLCVLSGTRLLLYKDKYKRTAPHVVQLARGNVEEAKLKGHDFCLRLTSTLNGERVIYLTFSSETEYNRWYKKCKKATDKLPTSADLSNCHLEFLPENIFVNDQLAMLNLRHNVLKERPIEDDIFVIGWLDDLSRFTKLRSLNLADNTLLTFPLAVCQIRTLVELNIASNKLEEIPPDVAELTNLQALHIHNNHLTSLPDEMVHLRKLFILVLAFNRFLTVPPVVAQMTNIRVSEIENIIMAGNRIERIPSETLMEMKYVKKVDLRMNQLSLTGAETMKFTVLEHLTHLDIRDNQVCDLDIRPLKTLEYLNCERNDMVLLKVNGLQLKNLFASQNCLESLHINPKPEYLFQLDLSYNQLRQLPDWLSDCFFLQRMNVSFNLLTDLPARLFIDAKKLKYLRADHNHLRALPTEVDVTTVEEVLVHHNLLSYLPDEFFVNANKLRVFNASKNRLIALPPVNPNQDLNKLQELYLSCNTLGDSSMEVIAGFPRLKVLHIAHNELQNLSERHMEKMEVLQELNISGNELRTLPKSIGALSKLVILRAHSNVLHCLPDFHRAKSLRVLDVGHNQLFNVSVTSLMASQLNLLDMSLNTQLKVNPREFKSVKNRKSVCLVDATGQNRDLPGLKRQSVQTEEETNPNTPWKVGFSETSGIRNKLCVGTLKQPKFQDEDESLFGMFDGGHNDELPKLLIEKMPDIVKNELKHRKTEAKYMKYAMLSAHRCLRSTGQKLGASGVLVHIQRVAKDQMNMFNLALANVGDIEVVLCRHGEALVLTRKFVTQEDPTECDRVQETDGIITEDSKVNGVSKNTRMLGCAFLYPHIIPMPYTCDIALRNDDEFLIMANKGLWKYITYGHAVEEIYEIGNPVVAAKRLQDLAQGYGSKENISILVVRLNTDRGPSLGRLRPQPKEMSVDDVEAAAKHDAIRAKNMAQIAARKEQEQQKPKRPERGRVKEDITPKQSVQMRKAPLPQVPDSWSSSVGVSSGSTDTLTIDNVDQYSENHRQNGVVDSGMITNHPGPVHNGYSNGYVDENANVGKNISMVINAEKERSYIHSQTGAVGSTGIQTVELVRKPLGNVHETNSSVLRGGSRNVSVHSSDSSTIHGSTQGSTAGSVYGSALGTVEEYVHGSGDHNSHIHEALPLLQESLVDEVTPVHRPSSVLSDDMNQRTSIISSASEMEEPKEGSPSLEAINNYPPNQDLKPLPNQRFVKKDAAQEWESLLQKRLSSEVKDKEMKQIGNIMSGDDLDDVDSGSRLSNSKQISTRDLKDSDMVVIESIGRRKGQTVTQVLDTRKTNISDEGPGTKVLSGSVRIKADNNMSSSGTPWFAVPKEANPAYTMNPGISNNEFLKMTSGESEKASVPKAQPKNVRSRIAMFENLKKDEPEGGHRPREESRRMFFSPMRTEPKPAVFVPPRRCLSPPPNLVIVSRSDQEHLNQTVNYNAQSPKAELVRPIPHREPIIKSPTQGKGSQSRVTGQSLKVTTSVNQSQSVSPGKFITTDSRSSPRRLPATPNTSQNTSQPAMPTTTTPTPPPRSRDKLVSSDAQRSRSQQQRPTPSPVVVVKNTSPGTQNTTFKLGATGGKFNKEHVFHGSVESDLYSKVKRVKKDAPFPPGEKNVQQNISSELLQESSVDEEYPEGGSTDIVELTYL